MLKVGDKVKLLWSCYYKDRVGEIFEILNIESDYYVEDYYDIGLMFGYKQKLLFREHQLELLKEQHADILCLETNSN